MAASKGQGIETNTFTATTTAQQLIPESSVDRTVFIQNIGAQLLWIGGGSTGLNGASFCVAAGERIGPVELMWFQEFWVRTDSGTSELRFMVVDGIPSRG